MVGLMVVLTSCGAGYHLRRAQHHLKKAEFKGAKVDRTTTVKTVTMTAPKLVFTTKLSDIVVNDTIINNIVEIPDGKGNTARLAVDTVTKTVVIECPEQEVKADVETSTETNISAPRGFMYYVGLLWWVILAAFIVGVLTGAKILAFFRALLPF